MKIIENHTTFSPFIDSTPRAGAKPDANFTATMPCTSVVRFRKVF